MLLVSAAAGEGQPAGAGNAGRTLGLAASLEPRVGAGSCQGWSRYFRQLGSVGTRATVGLVKGAWRVASHGFRGAAAESEPQSS